MRLSCQCAALLLPLIALSTAQAQQPVYVNASARQAMAPQQGAPQHIQHHYPQLDAPMNPVPRANIPIQTGATLISNQAFAPHEMLYPHRYRALYPPYYYKVKGGWLWTPFGIRQKEQWKLQGTLVDVKYKSHISPFSGFRVPFIR